jgi:hypothetical protein
MTNEAETDEVKEENESVYIIGELMLVNLFYNVIYLWVDDQIQCRLGVH